MSFLKMKESKIYNYMIFAGGDSEIRTHASFYTTRCLANTPLNHLSISPYWCEWRELNPHGKDRKGLNFVRIPVSPHSQIGG